VTQPTAVLSHAQPKPLSLWLATALVIGNMIGSGIILLPASLAGYRAWSLVGWGFTAVGAFLLAWVFARLAQAYPKTGGPYAYSRKAFGDFVGFQTAWGYWIAAWLGNVVIATGFVSYSGRFWHTMAGSSTGDHIAQAGLAIAAIWLLTFVNVLGIRQAGVVQAATTVLKTLPLAAIAVVGIFWIQASNFPFHPESGSNMSAFSGAAALTLWAFIGLESATIPAESVVNAKRNVRRATLLGTAITAVIYLLGMVAVVGIIAPADLGSSTAPFADAAQKIWGSTAGDLVAIGAIVSAFGCLNGWILLQGQMPYAAARDNLFPKSFAKLNRAGVPAFGIVASSVLLTLAIIPSYNSSTTERFTDFVFLATTTTIIAYLYGVASQMVLFVTDRKRFPMKRVATDMTLAALAVAYSIYLLFGAGYRYTTWAFMVVAAGFPVYAWLRYQAGKEHPELLHTEDAEPVVVETEDRTLVSV
jgi:basic amino acid/polyamine antiporter, APA family